MSCMHDLATNKENHDTNACCCSIPKETILPLGADSGPAEPKIVQSTSPGPDLLTDATPRTHSVVEGPSPRRGNISGFRRTFEAQGLGALVPRRARTTAPHPRSTSPTSTRSFVSSRRKSRGDPKSRTGFQCGQFIVGEGSQRPVIKVYVYMLVFTSV